MKKIITLFLISLTIYSCGVTKTPVSIEPISRDVPAAGSSADLYVKANNWMVENFRDAKSVIQFSDKEAGIVTGKYLMYDGSYSSAYQIVDGAIFAIVKIQVKDGATRITISPDNYTAVGSSLAPDYEFTEAKARKVALDLIDSFESYMNTEVDDF